MAARKRRRFGRSLEETVAIISVLAQSYVRSAQRPMKDDYHFERKGGSGTFRAWCCSNKVPMALQSIFLEATWGNWNRLSGTKLPQNRLLNLLSRLYGRHE